LRTMPLLAQLTGTHFDSAGRLQCPDPALAKPRLLSMVVSWGSEISNAFCDEGGKSET